MSYVMLLAPMNHEPEFRLPPFDDILRITRAADTPRSGWTTLLTLLERYAGRPIPQLGNLSIETDVESIREQLKEMVGRTPPPSNVNTVCFGIIEVEDEDGNQRAGLVVAGHEHHDVANGVLLDDAVWTAENTYLDSSVFETILRAETAAAEAGRDDECVLLGYTAQLAAALLVCRFAVRDLFTGLTVMVGYEDGDFAVIS